MYMYYYTFDGLLSTRDKLTPFGVLDVVGCSVYGG